MIKIYGSVWARLSDETECEYDDDEIKSLTNKNILKWYFLGDQFEDESCIVIATEEGSERFEDLHEALSYIRAL